MSSLCLLGETGSAKRAFWGSKKQTIRRKNRPKMKAFVSKLIS
jgi:hypothetical protein